MSNTQPMPDQPPVQPEPARIEPYRPPPIEATPAYLLCLFLGGLGIHQFYLGNKLRALVYLLTFFGVCGLLPLIDLFTMRGQLDRANRRRALGI